MTAASTLRDFKQRLAFYVLASTTWSLHWLPFPLLVLGGYVFGLMGYSISRRRKYITRINLSRCLPQKSPGQIELLVLGHFLIAGATLLTGSLALWSSKSRISRLVRTEGNLAQIQASDRAVIYFLPHFLNMEVQALLTIKAQKTLAIAYQRQRNPYIDQWICKRRSRFGYIKTLLRDQSARSFVRHLQQQQPINISSDQDFGPVGAEFVPFFGIPAATLTVIARLARLSQAPVTPIIVLSDGLRGWKIRILPDLKHFPGAMDDKSATAYLNQQLESWIMANPSQYLWSHRRFKTRPKGTSGFYGEFDD